MEEDFSQWYTDVVKKAELMDYSSVKGCMVIEPYGYALWEICSTIWTTRFKKVGVQNVVICPCLSPRAFCKRKRTM